MPPGAFLLSGGDRGKFQTLWSAHKSRSQGGGNDRRAEAYGVRSNVNRVARAYGSVAGRSGTTPGRGEMKFLRISTDDHTLGDVDELPTTVYNLGTSAIADGDYLIAHLDLSGKFVDEGRTIGQAVWITGEGAGGGPSGYAQLITSDSLGADDRSVVFEEWEHEEESTPATLFELVDANDLAAPDGRKQGIKILTPGMYLIGFNATLENTTSGYTALVVPSLGYDLCADFSIQQIDIGLTLNDDAVDTSPADPLRDIIGTGANPGHYPIRMSALKFCGKGIHANAHHSSPAVLAADDVVRLFVDNVTGGGSLVLTCDIWAQYIGPDPAYDGTGSV